VGFVDDVVGFDSVVAIVAVVLGDPVAVLVGARAIQEGKSGGARERKRETAGLSLGGRLDPAVVGCCVNAGF